MSQLKDLQCNISRSSILCRNTVHAKNNTHHHAPYYGRELLCNGIDFGCKISPDPSISVKQIFASGSAIGTTRFVDIFVQDDKALEGNQTFTVAIATSDSNMM